MHKDTKQFLRKVQKTLPLEVVRSGHHIFVQDRKGHVVATVSGSASDKRAVKNMRGDIRRAGYRI